MRANRFYHTGVASLLLISRAAAADPATEPIDLGLEERTERRLIQLDVTVTGPPDVISNLTAEDFEIAIGNRVLGGTVIEDFYIDRVCSSPQAPKTEVAVEVGKEQTGDSAAAPRPPKANYAFFFDRSQMTQEGHARSGKIARDLIRRLVTPDSPATIVSSAMRLKTFARASTDHDELLEAIDRMESDPDQFDPHGAYAIDRVMSVWEAASFSWRFADARSFRLRKEEIAKAHTSLYRLSSVARDLAELGPPKILFYFGDTLSSRPGELLGWMVGGHFGNMDIGPVDPWAAAEVFDEAIQQATASGVRVYAVQSAGFEGRIFANETAGRARHSLGWVSNKVRRSAMHSLSSLARETGGRAFLNNAGVEQIVRAVNEDFSCFYVISFDASGLPENQRLGVQVGVTRPHVSVKTRRLLRIPSPSAQAETDLLDAFLRPDAGPADDRLRGSLIPVDYSKGKYSALVQVQTPASLIPDTEWRIGVHLVHRGKVRQEEMWAVTVNAAGSRAVLEASVQFPPGEFSLAMIGHDTSGDRVVTGELLQNWPAPDRSAASVSAIAVAQPASAVFARGGEVRTHGSLGCPEDGPVLSDRPTAFVGLVCRRRTRGAGTLELERSLSGALSYTPERLQLAFGDGDRCAQFRDVVPRGVLDRGESVYHLRVLDEDAEIASAERRFTVTDPPRSEGLTP